MRLVTRTLLSTVTALFLTTVVFACGERHTGIQLRAGAVASRLSLVTEFALTNQAGQDSIDLTKAQRASFTVTVREGQTSLLVSGAGAIELANPDKDVAALRAVKVCLEAQRPGCGWVAVAAGTLGDGSVFTNPLPRRDGGVPIALTLADSSGRAISAAALPALAPRSKASFRIGGTLNATALQDLVRARLRMEVSVALTIAARASEGGEWVSEMKDYASFGCLETSRVNSSVLLSAWVSAFPDSSIAKAGELSGQTAATCGRSASFSLCAANGYSMRRTIDASGKPGTATVVALAGPVQINPSGCGTTPFALTAALAGCGQAPDGMKTLQGNPGTATVSLIATACAPKSTIEPGFFVTYTQGGWGAAPNGRNAGTIRDANFARIFPGGLWLGSTRHMHFTTVGPVAAFLPQGGTSGMLVEDLEDPVTTPAGVLAGQLVAAGLNLQYSSAGVLGQTDPMPLAQLLVARGPFAGMSVANLLGIANLALGGQPEQLPPGATLSDLADAVKNFNECFDNGTVSTGFLRKP